MLLTAQHKVTVKARRKNKGKRYHKPGPIKVKYLVE